MRIASTSSVRGRWNILLFFLSISLLILDNVAYGQIFDGDITHLDTPLSLWKESIGVDIREDNGIFASPDNSMIVITSRSSAGTIIALDPISGMEMNRYTPTGGNSVQCFGGIRFVFDNQPPAMNQYMVYMVVDNNGGMPTTRVLVLDMNFNLVFESVPLDGIGVGTPVTSSDGIDILVTHNVDGLIGYFTVLSWNDLELNDAETIIQNNNVYDPLVAQYQESNTTAPFGEIGYFHEPAEGHYDGGESNNDDIFVWSFDIPEGTATFDGTPGQIFIYQKPTPTYQVVGPSRDFYTHNPPILTNSGRSLYWSVSKADNQCWIGQQGVKNNYYSRGRTNKRGFGRGTPPIIAARAPPTLSSNTMMPDVYGPGARSEIWKMNYRYDLASAILKNVSAVVYNKLLLSPDDERVYYTTNNGVFACSNANAFNADDFWNVATGLTVEGEMAMIIINGLLNIYIPSTTGVIDAYQVAMIDLGPSISPITAAPTISPSQQGGIPSDNPSSIPTEPAVVITAAPSLSPTTESPTRIPTEETLLPSAFPTGMPSPKASVVPTITPTSIPSSQPIGDPTPKPTTQTIDDTDRPTREPIPEPTPTPTFTPQTSSSSRKLDHDRILYAYVSKMIVMTAILSWLM